MANFKLVLDNFGSLRIPSALPIPSWLNLNMKAIAIERRKLLLKFIGAAGELIESKLFYMMY